MRCRSRPPRRGVDDGGRLLVSAHVFIAAEARRVRSVARMGEDTASSITPFASAIRTATIDNHVNDAATLRHCPRILFALCARRVLRRFDDKHHRKLLVEQQCVLVERQWLVVIVKLEFELERGGRRRSGGQRRIGGRRRQVRREVCSHWRSRERQSRPIRCGGGDGEEVRGRRM